ncbi:replicative DNA helicase [Apibacter muscae]|uniref:DNA 5'-3' helicase n=1 Tax=Apibacter muscae TaxID=2509004 RepID=A0A563DE87_9FLAO|nr:replicative DNA helicase [Apibacter muscae]TWP28452.1 replicative DNA helicase [Apibacter muscae]
MNHLDLKLLSEREKIELDIISTLVSYHNSFSVVADKLDKYLFSKYEFVVLFEIIQDLFQRSVRIDLINISTELRKRKLLGAVDEVFLINVTNYSTTTANLERNVFLLVELATKDQCVKGFNELANLANDDSTDVFELRDRGFKFFEKILIDQFTSKFSNRKTFKDLINIVKTKAISIKDNPMQGVYSSLSVIQKAIGGWQKTDLSIVAARPGMGKTAFMIQCIIDALKAGMSVGVFSLEMSSEQLTTRISTNITKIPNYSFIRLGFTPGEEKVFNQHQNHLENLKIEMDDTASLSITDLRIRAKTMKIQKNIDILFVDYLQLISGEKGNKGNREQEISAISRGLKAIAKELDIPVIALSQLSRSVESRGGSKRPLLSDLRESGAIEQDADEVLFLYRPEYYKIDTWLEDYNNEKATNQAEIIIAKNRHGGLLADRCMVDLPTSRFYDIPNESVSITANPDEAF